MPKFFLFQITSTLLVGFLLSSCKVKKENFDIDFSNYKVPKKIEDKNLNIDISLSTKTENEIIENKLKDYKKKSEVINSGIVGKKDPFSTLVTQENKLHSNFELTGFLNTGIDKYVFVSYLNNKGTISEGSIGGINTNLLPNGAKVIDIDTKNMTLIINFENEEYTFEL